MNSNGSDSPHIVPRHVVEIKLAWPNVSDIALFHRPLDGVVQSRVRSVARILYAQSPAKDVVERDLGGDGMRTEELEILEST